LDEGADSPSGDRTARARPGPSARCCGVELDVISNRLPLTRTYAVSNSKEGLIKRSLHAATQVGATVRIVGNEIA